jgi:hypothetical protein
MIENAAPGSGQFQKWESPREKREGGAQYRLPSESRRGLR